mgnify:CR=1 FL=1
MVIGPFINASAVLLGGVLGALLSQRLPERIRVSMTSILVWHRWGLVFTGGEMRQPSGDGLATLLGALIGEICLLEKASIPRSPKHKICFATHVRSQRMNLLFRIMSRLLSCLRQRHRDLRGDERRDDRRPEYFNRQVISRFLYGDDLRLLVGYCGVGN